MCTQNLNVNLEIRSGYLPSWMAHGEFIHGCFDIEKHVSMDNIPDSPDNLVAIVALNGVLFSSGC